MMGRYHIIRIEDGLRALFCDNEEVFRSASEDIERIRMGSGLSSTKDAVSLGW